jgi:hypothetical protein
MLAERTAEEEDFMIEEIEKMLDLDLPHCTTEKDLPKIKEFVSIFDSMLKAHDEDFEFKHDWVRVRGYVVKKSREKENYNLHIMNFLDYNPNVDCSGALRSPGVRIKYNAETKEIHSVAKLALNERGRLFSAFMPKKD